MTVGPQTAQGARQASIRAVTGSAETYEGDWHRLFDSASIPAGTYDERLLRWINLKLSSAYTNLPEAQQALAVANGAANFSSMGTFSASSSPPVNTVAPAITGTETYGNTLTCSTGTWSGSPTGYAYQWKRSGTNIAAATASTYALVVADLGAVITCVVTATNAAGSASATSNSTATITAPAPFTTVNGPTADPAGGAKFEGWSVNYASQPTVSSPVPFTVSRQGYSATDSASADTTATTAPLDTFYVTSTVRQPYPNNASQSALTAALSDYIYSTDTPSGSVTNNCTLTSPQPVAKHALPARRVVGNTVRLEVTVGHRNARARKQIAGVVFTATDGSTTVTATVATPAVSTYAYDLSGQKVIVYGVDLDITTLTNNASFTVDAIAYPHIGTAASRRKTTDGTATNYYEFATQTYYKSTSRTSSPPLAYIIPGGVDAVVDANGASGGNTKISTTAATALANGFATIKSALEALKAATNVTGGITDGCEIRISNCTAVWPATAVTTGTYQSAGEVIITRDPLQLRAACIFSLGGANTSCRQQWVRIRDLTVDRAGGTNQIILATPGQLTIENCDFNNSSRASQLVGSASVNQVWLGTSISGATTQLLSAGATPQGIIRAVTATGVQVEAGCVVGCLLTGSTAAPSATRGTSNVVVSFNRFLSLTASCINVTAANMDGMAVLNNVFEWIGNTATGATTFAISADGNTNNLTHVVMHNNTLAGVGACGRRNIVYDETTGTARSHKLISDKGNITPESACKGDIFKLDGTRVGGFGYYYAAGSAGNVINYPMANVTSEQCISFGTGSLVNTGASVTTPLYTEAQIYTSYAGTTWNGSAYVAGAGGGVYTLVAGSPVLGNLADAVLSHTLDGTARSATNDNPGALSVAA